jgi:hypothetical protein
VLICCSPIRSARSDGHSAGLPSAASSGRTSPTHCSSTSTIHGHTASTLHRFGGEPFIALPWRTKQTPKSPNSAACGLAPKSTTSSIRVSLRRNPYA